MLPLAPILIGIAIGKILKDDSKPQETKVVTQYVQDNHYHYTQNNYTYNVNVNNRSYKKHLSYRPKAKFVICNNEGKYLTGGGSWIYDSDYAKKFSIEEAKACKRKLIELGYRCHYDKL